ncbi:MAG: peptide deformylase [Candidatus Peribacteria bacterium]|nr:peptide deformylase [Candidatus Peribacteria bacterium]
MNVSVFPIVTGADNPILRQKTRTIPAVTKKTLKLIEDMKDSMAEAKGVGLAAPQIGSNLRVCLAYINEKIVPLINPVIVHKSKETVIDEEGCLSLPKIWIKVPRAVEITLRYTDEKGKPQERKLQNFDARVVQHEVDHLEGVLIVDYK